MNQEPEKKKSGRPVTKTKEELKASKKIYNRAYQKKRYQEDVLYREHKKYVNLSRYHVNKSST